MATDKLHARSKGANFVLTRQPTEGRGKMGGFRVGEMEAQQLVAHGATQVVRDRLFLQSDPYEVPVCNKCGLFAEPKAPPGVLTLNHTQAYCQHCNSHEDVYMVPMPYCMKLMLQEFQGLHIAPRLSLESARITK